MATAGTIQSIIQVILSSLLDPLVLILIGLAIIIFAYGLFNYLKSGMGDTTELKSAKSLMFWGVVIIFSMLSVWGLVLIFQNVFFGDSVPTNSPDIPQFDIGTIF